MALSRIYLKNLCETVQTYFRGAAYHSDGRVSITMDNTVQGGGRAVSAMVLGGDTAVLGGDATAYQTEILISASGERLTKYKCDCPAFDSYEGACKHIIALALCANDKNGEAVTEARTDSAALLMLRQYAQKAIQEAPVLGSGQGVKLIPRLVAAMPVPMINLKIGIDRMYVVKDISAFIKAVKGGELYAYGKQFSFVHQLAAFDEESARLVRFLLTYYDGNNYVYSGGYYYSSGNRNRDMFLQPFMLDAFIAVIGDRPLAIEIGGITDSFLVRAENPRLRLHIDRQKSGEYIVRLTKPFYPLRGSDCIYLLLEQTVYQCDAAYSGAVEELFMTLMLAPRHQIVVAERDMPTLAATLLPVLESHLTVVSNSTLSQFQPPKLQSRVYFDMPEVECVTARLEHHYGDIMHPGFGTKDIRQSFDLRGESKLETLLLRYFSLSARPGELFLREDEAALYELAEHGVSEISALAEVFATDAFKSLRVKPPAAVSVGVRVESNLLRLHFDVQGMDLAELEQVLQSYHMAKKYHRLRDGSFLNLEDSSLSEFSELAQGLDLSAKEIMAGELSLPKYRALYLDAQLKQSERLQYDRDAAFKRIIRDVRNVSDADYQIPKSLHSILRNYQKTGYRWMRTIADYGFGGILADDMGLGKTLQVIALLLAQKEEDPAHRVSIVVCPSSLVLNWESEVRKFAPALQTAAIVGVAARREELIRGAYASADLFVTSYDSLKRDVELYEKISFRYAIADEAQYMKNQNTQNAKSVKVLNAEARFALTGTPVENSLAEVWSVFDFLMPGYLYHYAKFRKQFESPIVKQGDEATAKNLRKMVSPFILRRMKKDVLKELPEKIETVLYAELEDEQKKLYLANAVVAKNELEAGLGDSGADKLQILAMLTRLRQICCDPALVYENYEQGSAKLELCMELVQNCIESEHRILLFSQFTSMLDRIAARLDESKVPYFTITGKTKSTDRLELVNTFNEGTTPIFLISLKAGGTGLNLTGADVVIHYDPWWNSSAQNQASDRAHRIGQTKTVQVYKLIAKDTLEERILEMQKSKADLADMIVREGDGAFARMSKDDLLALFT